MADEQWAEDHFQLDPGDTAIAFSDGLLDQSKTQAERRHDRLMITELERLDRLQRQQLDRVQHTREHGADG